MAFLSNLLAVKQPSGAWVGVIKAFEGAVGNYIVAIILLTLVIRLVWSVVETFNKYNTQKMSGIQSQMQPELEKLEAKYSKQPQVLQQKKNELQQRYMGKSQVGSCLITLVAMVLNLVIFFTLFSGLNSMASYKISSSYDSIKYTYANCLNVADKYLTENNSEAIANFTEYQNLKFVIIGEGENKTISLIKVDYDNTTVLVNPVAYKYDFGQTIPAPAPVEGEEQGEDTVITSNEKIYELIVKYFPVDADGKYDVSKDLVLKTQNIVDEEGQPVLDEEGQPMVETLYLSQAIQNVAMQNVLSEYDANKEGFLWIDNIWIADSPLEKSVLSYKSIATQMGKKNVGKYEEQIYNAFMLDLKEERSEVNGFFILPILCVLVSMLSVYITTQHNKRKNAKKGLPPMKQNAKWAQVIVPVLLGVFALFYNSVFAAYMLTGQLVSTALLPLQLFIIDKILEKKEKKEEKKVTVDYSRKF